MAGFGDVRVADRARWFVDRIAATGSLVLSRIGGDRAGEMAAQRLLASPHASVAAVIDTLSARAAQACAGREIVCAQDTTEINFKGRAAARAGLGPAGDGASPGFFVHPLVAIDAQSGALLGVGGAKIWTRAGEPAGPRRARAPQAKESIRWLEGARRAGEVFARARRISVVGDRESDIYHLFAHRPANVDLIVRAAQDRALEGGERLFGALADEPAAETAGVEVASRGPGKPARAARLEVRARRVAIRRPASLRAGDAPAAIEMTLVEAREIDPPEGARPVLWRIVASAERPAREIIALYRLRWRVEEVFRAMKSGLGLPDTQVRGAERLFLLTAFALGGAARVIMLVDARGGSSRPAADAVDPAFRPALAAISKKLEGRTQRQKNPHDPGSLAFVSWICARLGGWNCYYKPPGPKTMNTGWNALAQQLAGWALATECQNA